MRQSEKFLGGRLGSNLAMGSMHAGGVVVLQCRPVQGIQIICSTAVSAMTQHFFWGSDSVIMERFEAAESTLRGGN
jgi:hypothetical protein